MNLVEQIKRIQRPQANFTQWALIDRYNSMVTGIQNYYSLATSVSLDLNRVQFELSKVIENRLHPTKEGHITQEDFEKFNRSKQARYLAGRPILPIGYVQWKKPMNKDTKANIYTKEGVSWLGQRAKPEVMEIQKYMLTHPVRDQSIEYNDNRLSLVSAQHGKDKITGLPLTAEKIECHHVTPRSNADQTTIKTSY